MRFIDLHSDAPWQLLKKGFTPEAWLATQTYKTERELLDIDVVYALYLSDAWQDSWGSEGLDRQLLWTHGLPFGIEGGRLLGRDPVRALKDLHYLSCKALKYLTLVHNRTNNLANSAIDEAPHHFAHGLSLLGVKVVETCHELGIKVDVSHASDRAVAAALEIGPVVATHSGCRALTEHPRNLPDHLLERVSLIGIPFVENFLRGSSFGAHVEHAGRIAGGERVAVGSDLDGARLVPDFTSDYDWKRFVITELQAQGLPEQSIKAVTGDNAAKMFEI